MPTQLTKLATDIQNGDDATIIQDGIVLVQQVKTIISALGTIASELKNAALALTGIDSAEVVTFAEQLTSNLLSYLLITYVESIEPGYVGLATLLGIVDYVNEPGVANDPTHPAYTRRQLNMGNLGQLFTNPLQLLETVYAWGSPTFDGSQMMPRLSTGLNLIGFATSIPAAPGNTLDAPLMTIAPNPATTPPGLLWTFHYGIPGTYNLTIPVSARFAIQLQVQGSFGANLVMTVTPPASISLALPGATLDGLLQFLLVGTGVDASHPLLILGEAGSSRIEAKQLSVGGGITLTATTAGSGTADPTFSAAVTGGNVVIDTKNADGFIGSILSGADVQAPFQIGVTWRLSGGLQITGGAQLEIALPLHVTLGSVTIPTLYLIGGITASGLTLEVSVALGATLGPIELAVNRLGTVGTLTFPNGGGNLGPADLQISFKPPTGIGLALDVAGLTGGGYLDCNVAAAQYAGMMQMAYQQFQLQAFGLIATKLPTGPGYSLVAMIDANFPPIELVAGFTLSGVGGLLGVNRTISIDALEAGIKAKTLSNFLFTKNPVANAAQLLTDLDTFFPAAQGRYVFGPLLQISWGTPTVVTIDLALILELPDPVRLVLIGELAVLLPNPDAVLVELHMDVLGTINFGTDEGSLDAVLHDSRILHFPLQGAMALRGCWAGDDKTFLLAVGGFHPKFQPPPGFPTLQRVSISMPSGHISKLNLNGYLAVSSNTLQIGAHVDIFVGIDGFGISGYLNFDTLIQRNPFYFDGNISGGVTLSAGGDDIMSLDLTADLSGPAPWHCAGSVHFSILWFSVTKSFSVTFGDTAATLPTTRVDVGAGIRAALSDPRSFSATLITNENGLVTLRTSTVSGVVLGHPGATLNINQNVCPLGLTIQRFGADAPAGDSLFTITSVTADGAAQTPTSITDEFAPSQFLNLSDDDELAAPSFETFDSGVAFGDGALSSGPILSRPIVYETLIVDTPGGAPREDAGYTPPSDRLSGILTQLENSGRLRYAMPSQRMVRLPTPNYVIATTDEIAASGVGVATGQTFAQARVALAAAIAQNPDQRGTLQVVASYEVAA